MGLAPGVGVGVAGGVDVGVAVAVAVGVGVGVRVTVGVAVAVGDGVGLPCAHMKISIELSGVIPSLAYPPDSQILLVPLVSVGKLRRAVTNGIPIDQQQMSTSLEGLGATLPPPMTYMFPLKFSPRVSPVALGIAGMEPMVLVARLKVNELVVSTTVPPW